MFVMVSKHTLYHLFKDAHECAKDDAFIHESRRLLLYVSRENRESVGSNEKQLSFFVECTSQLLRG